MRLILATLLMACVMSIALSQTVKPPINCIFRCSNVQSLVWASDGQQCYVFKNNCFFLNENCRRRNQNKKVLRKVGKKQCQTMCNDVCTKVSDPVCGTYNGKKRTFSNPCQMDSHICTTGEFYTLVSKGACPKTTTTDADAEADVEADAE